MTRELVATEVVRALVGSIGLVASVPIATWLAAAVVTDPDSSHASGHEPAPSPEGDPAPSTAS